MNNINNVPLGCPKCGNRSNAGKVTENRVRGKIIVECNWRCSRCGSHIRRAIIEERNIEPKK